MWKNITFKISKSSSQNSTLIILRVEWHLDDSNKLRNWNPKIHDFSWFFKKWSHHAGPWTRSNLRPAVNRQPWFPREKTRREDFATSQYIRCCNFLNMSNPVLSEPPTNLYKKRALQNELSNCFKFADRWESSTVARAVFVLVSYASQRRIDWIPYKHNKSH